MDELFTRYMYYERAKKGIKRSTTEALRSFYGAGNYALLRNEETLSNMELLADFWNDVYSMSDDRFSQRVLRQLFVLNYAPNSMWTFFVSVYFLCKKDENNQLDDEEFYNFLTKSIAFIWAYAITNPGVNALRTPIYAEMVNLINGKDAEFAEFRLPLQQTVNQFNNYNFYNGRPITKSMLVWWCMADDRQERPSLDTIFEIEHIYARNRYELEKSLSSKEMVEMLGNKSILEKRINIRASDFRFGDKVKYYNGYTTDKGDEKKATCIQELKRIARDNTDFAEEDIKKRTANILESFCKFLEEQGLIK